MNANFPEVNATPFAEQVREALFRIFKYDADPFFISDAELEHHKGAPRYRTIGIPYAHYLDGGVMVSCPICGAIRTGGRLYVNHYEVAHSEAEDAAAAWFRAQGFDKKIKRKQWIEAGKPDRQHGDTHA